MRSSPRDATDLDRIARSNKWTDLLKKGEARLADLTEEGEMSRELGR